MAHRGDGWQAARGVGQGRLGERGHGVVGERGHGVVGGEGRGRGRVLLLLELRVVEVTVDEAPCVGH